VLPRDTSLVCSRRYHQSDYQKVDFMIHINPRHTPSLRRYSLAAVTILAGLLVGLVGASSALATPEGEYAVFAHCPLANSEVRGCLTAVTESGKFIVGKEEVPISSPITLQGGFRENLAGETKFFGAEGGETLVKSPQKVPGGLAGLIKCNEITGGGFWETIERGTCEAIFENEFTGAYATTELAAPATSIQLSEDALLLEKGTALTLPVKIHLESPLLGSECYLGSNSHPIDLEFTTGTTSPPKPNEPIKGRVGLPETNAEGTILTIFYNTLVNNTFAAPGASGCGEFFAFLLDPIIDAKLGIPATAGHNTAVLNSTLHQASAVYVREH
jgi:hypothetical protein